jgi:hypothetical protein
MRRFEQAAEDVRGLADGLERAVEAQRGLGGGPGAAPQAAGPGSGLDPRIDDLAAGVRRIETATAPLTAQLGAVMAGLDAVATNTAPRLGDEQMAYRRAGR